MNLDCQVTEGTLMTAIDSWYRTTVETIQERQLVCLMVNLFLIAFGEGNPHLLFRVVDLSEKQHEGGMGLLSKWSKR